MTTRPDISTKAESLTQWFTNKGGWLHPGVRIAHDESRGFHMQAAEQLPASTVVATCPLNATISYLNLDHQQSYVPCISSPLQKLFDKVPNHVLTYLLLIEQLVLEESSEWHPYIDMLPDPDDFSTPTWASAEERKLLEGTPVLQAAIDREKQWRSEHALSRAALIEAGLEDTELFEECDFDNYKWAATILDSRSFISTHLLPSLPTFAILFPVVDIANHSNAAKVQWYHLKDESFSLQLLEFIDQGSEVCNNYAPKQNGELLLGYGFAIPDNPYEQVSFKLRTSDDLLVGRQAGDVPFGMDTSFLDEDQQSKPHFMRPKGHPFGRFQNSISFFRGFPPYSVFASFCLALRTCGFDHGDPDARLVLATLLFLYRAVQIKCEAFPYPYHPASTFGSAKERFFTIYRDGQAKICHMMRRELKSVLETLRVCNLKQDFVYSQRFGIFTISEAVKVLRIDYPNYYEDFVGGVETLYRVHLQSWERSTAEGIEEEIWALFLMVILVTTSSIYGHTSPNTAIAKWTDDLMTTYDFDFSSPSDEDHEEDHDEDHDEDHHAASIVTALTTLSQYLSLNSIDSIWKIIASSAYRNRMIAWALKVVHCEAFVMPDQTNGTLPRVYMYMYMRSRPVSLLDDVVSTAWMYEDVEIMPQEPEGSVDVPIFRGKFF